MARNSGKLRVFILGSCVSRDAFERFEASDLELAGYVKYTSLASAFSKPVNWPETKPLDSAFRDRMLRVDLNKEVETLIANTPWDVLLVDFIEERFDVLRKGNSTVTLSAAFQDAGLVGYAHDQGFEPLRVDAQERQELWTFGWRQLMNLVASLGGDRAVAVNCARWALRNGEGESVVRSPNLAHLHNVALRSMYRVVERNWPDVRLIHYPDELIVADSNHQWGEAPFHYRAEFYDFLLRSLKEIAVAGRSGSGRSSVKRKRGRKGQ